MNNPSDYYRAKLDRETDSADLYAALIAGENLIVIDARRPEAWVREHIPGAVNLHHRDMTEITTALISRSALCVIYCDGIGCNASTKGALKMAQLGFRVKELTGGLDWWKRDGYATAGLQASAGATFNCAC